MNERWCLWETACLLWGNLKFKKPGTIMERSTISKGNWQWFMIFQWGN